MPCYNHPVSLDDLDVQTDIGDDNKTSTEEAEGWQICLMVHIAYQHQAIAWTNDEDLWYHMAFLEWNCSNFD